MNVPLSLWEGGVPLYERRGGGDVPLYLEEGGVSLPTPFTLLSLAPKILQSEWVSFFWIDFAGIGPQEHRMFLKASEHSCT